MDQRKGQTVLEMLIGLSIVTIGLFAVLGLSLRNVYQGRESLNELAAGNFAREGIEIVRNIRDSNRYLNTNGDWKTGLDQTGDQAINTATLLLEQSSNPQSPTRIIRQLPNGSYQQGDTVSGVGTKFRRKVNLYPICAGSVTSVEEFGKDDSSRCSFLDTDLVGIQVFVEVFWTEAGESAHRRTLVVEDRLYNW